MKKKHLILFFAIIPAIILSQEFKRASQSGFFERGISFSPNGTYYAYYGTNKPKKIKGDVFPESEYYMNIIKTKSFNTTDTISKFIEYTFKDCIRFPEVFIEWKNDNEFFVFNIHTNLFYIVSIENSFKREKVGKLNGMNKKITYTDIVTQDIRFKYNSNLNKIIMFFSKENQITIKDLTENKLIEVKLDSCDEIFNFDIDVYQNKIIAFVHDPNNYKSNLIVYNYQEKKSKIVLRDIEVSTIKRASIQYFSPKDIIYKLEENGVFTFCTIDLINPVQTTLYSLKGYDDIVYFNYNPKSPNSLACTIWNKNSETPEKKLQHESKVFDVLTLFYVIMGK